MTITAAVDNTQANPHPLPRTFSPSSLLKFRKCPLEWKQSYLPKVETPGSVATVRGNLFHGVLEDLWMAPADERTLDTALDLVPTRWAQMTAEPKTWWSLVSDPQWDVSEAELRRFTASAHAPLALTAFNRLDAAPAAVKNPVGEALLLEQVRGLLTNYFTLEDPSLGSSEFAPPFFGPVKAVEFEARATFAGATFRGFVDRIQENYGEDGYSLVVTDYKTGKQKWNPEHLEDYWWQQATYGVLLEDMFGVPVTQLRLVFPSGEGGGRDYPRGRVLVRDFSQAKAQRHRLDMGNTYQALLDCWTTNTWPTSTSKLCNWCYFQDICPEFAS